ncbi:response regulator transcription factor [Actinocorallia populi]|uniref:response regulator transcription factor n=1 Tax=Actinocorallia populi TaxID=2079200 RepID=UPI001300A66E|nr:response regulator transcription factor [Actinocorallia populi]
MTRVRIIESDPVLRLGVAALLREAGDVRVVAGDAEVLVYGLAGAAGVREVERLARQGAVVALTSLESPSLLVGALAAGARGLLRHGCFDAADLAGAVRAAARGQAFLSPPVATALVEWLHSRAPAGAGRAGSGRLRALEHGLTPREAEIMELVAQGRDNRNIAARLFISEKTVKNHIHHIYRRLKADNRQHAIAKWCDIGAF